MGGAAGLGLAGPALPALAAEGAGLDECIYDLSALQYGEEVSLSRFRGQAVVVVNVASE